MTQYSGNVKPIFIVDKTVSKVVGEFFATVPGMHNIMWFAKSLEIQRFIKNCETNPSYQLLWPVWTRMSFCMAGALYAYSARLLARM